MKAKQDRIYTYGFALLGNIMVWGMFTLLNMPHPVAPVAYVQPRKAESRVLDQVATTGTPSRLIIPELAMDIAVGQGDFDSTNQSWTISDDKAYFATPSTLANDSNGTTLIYGHARDTMFAPLAKLSDGATAYVDTTNGKRFTYAFSTVREVVPTDVSVFTDSGPPTLVLQTCSGPWDSFRAMYSFTFIEVKNI